MSGESRLWQEVLLMAIADVARSRSSKEMAEAIAWFRTERCRDICSLVGKRPIQIKRIVFDLARRSPAQRKYWMEKIKEEVRHGRAAGTNREEEVVMPPPHSYHGI